VKALGGELVAANRRGATSLFDAELGRGKAFCRSRHG
jgi:hypothetical protein